MIIKLFKGKEVYKEYECSFPPLKGGIVIISDNEVFKVKEGTNNSDGVDCLGDMVSLADFWNI